MFIMVLFDEHNIYAHRTVTLSLMVVFSFVLVLLGTAYSQAFAAENSQVTTRTDIAARLGENINISVPSRVNYVAKSDGTLIAPSANALYLKNNSAYEVRVSQVQTNTAPGWTLVEDASIVPSVQTNAFDLSVTPKSEAGTDASSFQSGNIEEISDDALDVEKIINPVGQTTTPLDNAEPMWTMTAANADANSEDTKASELHFEMEGNVSQSNSAVRGTDSIGSIQWYVVADTVTDDFRARIESLENRMAAIEDEKDDIKNEIAAAKGRLDAIDGANGSVANLSGRVSSTENRLSASENKISNAENNIRSLQQNAAIHQYSLGITGDNISYTAFAWVPNGGTGNTNNVVLVAGAGDYGGYYGGLYLVQISGRSDAPHMLVTTISPGSQNPPVFGYWPYNNGYYFGMKNPRFRGTATIVVLSRSGADFQNFGNLSTAPSGWTEVPS